MNEIKEWDDRMNTLVREWADNSSSVLLEASRQAALLAVALIAGLIASTSESSLPKCGVFLLLLSTLSSIAAHLSYGVISIRRAAALSAAHDVWRKTGTFDVVANPSFYIRSAWFCGAIQGLALAGGLIAICSFMLT